MERYARVAVDLPLRETFHYSIPERLSATALEGFRCEVPFGGRNVSGYIVAVEDSLPPEVKKVKPLAEILDPEPIIGENLLKLARWASSYYHHPLGETISTFIPPKKRAQTRPRYALCEPLPEGLGEKASSLARKIASQRGEIAAPPQKGAEREGFEELLKKGGLKKFWTVEPPSAARGEKWLLKTAQAPDPATLGAKQARLAELLDLLSQGPVAQSSCGVGAATIKRAVEKGWAERVEILPSTDAASSLGYGEGGKLLLNEAQSDALAAIKGAMEEEKFKTFLLLGITGSGKTEVYLRAVDHALKMGRTALVLVPEISLTPQLIGRFAKRVGGSLAVLHSGLSERQRALQWELIRSGSAKVVVGTRSAVFAPLEKIGLIVVDEEHDPSFKQAEGLRYNAKHLAMVRGRDSSAAVVLGSATPEVESYQSAIEGRITLLKLPARATGATLPKIEIIDLRAEEKSLGRQVLISGKLKKAVDAALKRGEQALFFINRRGFSSSLYCPECEEAVRCRECSVPMTLHRRGRGGALLCHYCGKSQRAPEICPNCSMSELLRLGAGTQRIEEEIAALWPEARVARLDRDSAGESGGLEILRGFAERRYDIMVGTQMVAKGHHFPYLTVVGVLGADEALHFADFRAAERVYQTLTQVAGRAGRDKRGGEVFIQTRNPHHPALRAVLGGSYESFAESELSMRSFAGFSPFSRHVLLRFVGEEEEKVSAAATMAADWLKKRGKEGGTQVLGPAPAPVARVRGKWRYNILLKGGEKGAAGLQDLLRGFFAARGLANPSGVALQLDVDPVRTI